MNLESFCKTLDQELIHLTCAEKKVRKTEELLCELAQSHVPCCGQWDCGQTRYSRHLVYHGEESGCCVVAMAWGPGQGTPVHDHDGVWCVECCLQGELEITRYELCSTTESSDEPIYEFRSAETQRVGEGNVGSLIPPFEHHVIRNTSPTKAITLHVYGKELLRSSCFEPLGADRYRRVERTLSYASV